MFDEFRKPRLVRYDDIRRVVIELRRIGADARLIWELVTEVGPVDLDMLNEILRKEGLAVSQRVQPSDPAHHRTKPHARRRVLPDNHHPVMGVARVPA